MIHDTCRLTAKNRDQLRNPTLGNRVSATLLLLQLYIHVKPAEVDSKLVGNPFAVHTRRPTYAHRRTDKRKTSTEYLLDGWSGVDTKLSHSLSLWLLNYQFPLLTVLRILPYSFWGVTVFSTTFRVISVYLHETSANISLTYSTRDFSSQNYCCNYHGKGFLA